MERHSIDEDSAFEMLRESSRTANRKLVDLAAAGRRRPLPAPRATASPFRTYPNVGG